MFEINKKHRKSLKYNKIIHTYKKGVENVYLNLLIKPIYEVYYKFLKLSLN